METIEFKEHRLSRYCLYLKSIISNVKKGDTLYLLTNRKCIELRTQSQHKVLLDEITKLAQEKYNIEEKNKYKELEDKIKIYSKVLKVSPRGMLNLDSTVAGYYGLTNDCTVIIEKLSDCIRI